jgi:hypothetical protein
MTLPSALLYSYHRDRCSLGYRIIDSRVAACLVMKRHHRHGSLYVNQYGQLFVHEHLKRYINAIIMHIFAITTPSLETLWRRQ